MGDKGRAYTIVPSLANGIHAYSIQLKTHEDDFVPPQPLRGTTGHLLGDEEDIPFVTVFRALYTFWHMLDSIWHPKCPPSYLSIIPTLLRGLFFILWIYLVGLSPKGCSLYIILSLGASFGQIRQYESLRGSYKSMRGSFHSSSSLGLGIYLSKDFGPTICGMIWMIKCILMCGIFSLSLLELLFGKFMDGYTLFV